MVVGDEQAETLYVDAIERLQRTRMVIHLARARLRYGEWLRRMNRRLDARRQLSDAHEMFTRMGAQAFAERARRELVATGEKVRKQPLSSGDELTAQEAQIARLAGDGLTNQEIGAQLFISTHTVEWHLRKVFVKLGITSRRQLRTHFLGELGGTACRRPPDYGLLTSDYGHPRARPRPRNDESELRQATAIWRLTVKVVVIGGTGLIGSKVVDKLNQHGHQAIAAAPNTGRQHPHR